ncbi:MAG: sensor histidine kinase [Sedimenticola sp.]|nr:MAG: sensor histidine kinase [Sedimenticola sp.]
MNGTMKKRRILLLLIALVLLPLGFLGWQGVQMLDSSDAMQRVRSEQLVAARLKNVDASIQAYLQQLALDWTSRLPGWPLQAEQLRERRSQEIRVRQLFLLDAGGRRTFPNGEMSQAERRFVERLQMVWDDPSILYATDDSQRLEEQRAVSSLVSRSKTADSPSGRHGWSVWHWGTGTQLLFWWQAPEGHTLGLEVESARIKSDLISLLPDDPAQGEGYSMRLKDSAGQIIYQWGRNAIGNEAPLSSTPLAYPLSSWSLEYFAEADVGVNSADFGLLILFLSLTLALIGMAIYLYREHTREMRLAAQRVAFVGQVSHELKTPLTNIRLYAEMLGDQLEDNPQQQRYLQVITNESQRLSRLIGNVLNFSREPKIHISPVAVDPLIRMIVDNFRPGFTAKGIQVALDLQADRLVETDPDQLEQILNNLLSNVEKYAAEGKAVDIASAVEGGMLVVRVRDHGAGIPPSERKQVFKPFYRINNRLTEGVSGTGIGLTIARQQAHRLGGDLLLSDARPGACFELRIPLTVTP